MGAQLEQNEGRKVPALANPPAFYLEALRIICAIADTRAASAATAAHRDCRVRSQPTDSPFAAKSPKFRATRSARALAANAEMYAVQEAARLPIALLEAAPRGVQAILQPSYVAAGSRQILGCSRTWLAER